MSRNSMIKKLAEERALFKALSEDYIALQEKALAARERVAKLVEALKDIRIHSVPPCTGPLWAAYCEVVAREAIKGAL